MTASMAALFKGPVFVHAGSWFHYCCLQEHLNGTQPLLMFLEHRLIFFTILDETSAVTKATEGACQLKAHVLGLFFCKLHTVII